MLGIPSFNRAAELSRLLACLDRELAGVDDVVVMVSDNASDDRTQEFLRGAEATRPWLVSHRQAENIGALRNMAWLVENAPDGEYLWLFGDDDVIVPGALAEVRALLRAESPAWLFLPHHWVNEAGELSGGSPAPRVLQRYETGADLYRAYHHWLTFVSASIVRRSSFREAVRAVETSNAFGPLLWFYRAGQAGPCVVVDNHLVHGSLLSSWRDLAHEYLTTHLVGMYDEGLRNGLTVEEFGRSLDIFYSESLDDSLSLGYWRQVPVQQLRAAVARFPHSSALRSYLWQIARAQSWRDALPTLDEAARTTGVDAEAAALLAAGEEEFEQGYPGSAVTRFLAASQLMPTSVAAWNDLSVALHQLGDARAASAAESAVFVAPDDLTARVNRACLRHAAGDHEGAVSDARRASELAPDDVAVVRLLADAMQRLEAARDPVVAGGSS